LADEIALTKVTLVGPKMTVEREVDGATALRVVAVLLGGTDVAEPRPRHEGGGQSQSLTELFVVSDPRRNPDRVATAALYLANNGTEPFSREQIRATLRDARQKSFANFGRDFDWAVRNGWLDGNDNAGYLLTQSGRSAVEARFEKSVRDKTKFSKSASRTRRRKRAKDST
jgi:hypothetical protein